MKNDNHLSFFTVIAKIFKLLYVDVILWIFNKEIGNYFALTMYYSLELSTDVKENSQSIMNGVKYKKYATYKHNYIKLYRVNYLIDAQDRQ